MKSTDISVIITTYNRKEFVIEALESVYAQTCPPDEIIVIDDGSRDDTKAAITKIFPAVRYIYQRNQGISSARNAGILAAKATYIAFLDSDDLWEKKKLEDQIGYLSLHPDCKACYTDETWIRDGKHLNQKHKHRKYDGWIFEHCLPLCIISPSSIIIHRNVFSRIGMFDESLKVCEDYDFWLRLTLQYPVHFINKKLIVKRGGHKDQLSKKYWGMDRFRVLAMEKLLENSDLSLNKKQCIYRELHNKCHILSIGYKNRAKPLKSIYYEKKMQHYASIANSNT